MNNEDKFVFPLSNNAMLALSSKMATENPCNLFVFLLFCLTLKAYGQTNVTTTCTYEETTAPEIDTDNT